MKRIVYYFALLWVTGACVATPPQDYSRPHYVPDKDADNMVKLGIEYMRLGHSEVALDKLQRGLAMDARNPEAHAAIAILYESLGDLTRAREHYQRAVDLDPEESSAQNNYGSFLCRQNQAAQAEQHFLKALQNPLYKNPEVAYTNAGICFIRERDFDKAEVYLDKALQADPRFPNALYQMANLYYEKNRYPEAQNFLDRFLEIAEQTPHSLWLSVRLARAQGNKNKEASYALLLRSKFPDSEQARLLMKSETW